MKIEINTRHFELYFCNGHYDVRIDETSPNGLTLRFGKLVYRKGKGWRNLGFKFKVATIIAPQNTLS